MNRRRLLAATPAFGCAGILPTIALSSAVGAETPVMRLYRAWEADRAAWEVAAEGHLTDEENTRWCDRVYKMADDVLVAQSQGPLDFIYKLMAQTFQGEHDIGNCPRGDELWAEAQALTGVAA